MGEITMDLRLVFTIPRTGMTINGLIAGLKQGMGPIHAAILTTLLEAIEEKTVQQYLGKDPARYGKNGHQSTPRKMICSLGAFSYRFAQLRDRKTGRSFLPLAEALAIPAHVRFLEEALEPAIGLCAHVSYRRAAGEIERIQNQPMSHSTVHRRLQQFAQDHDPFGALQDQPFRFLPVDGTQVRLQGARGEDLGKVQMRWALASLGPRCRFEPVGFWIQTDWKTIRQDLARRLDYGKLRCLFSDGELGIAENLLTQKMQHQRCLWHGKRDFPYLLYADGLKKPQQQPFVETLNGIPALTMTRDRLESLRPEDRPRVEHMAEQTRQDFDRLLAMLRPETYPKARAYIEHLIRPVSSFLSWWLQKGQALPLTTNAIESAFSRVCNRIKRIGRRWSDQGLLNWLKMTFYKIFKPELWSLQWTENRKPLVKIKLLSVDASYQWAETIT